MEAIKHNPLLRSSLLALTLAFVGGGFLTACEDQGPAEEAGERIDDAAEDASDAAEDAADEVEREFD
ncbi:hypothetical protein G3T16_01580 [Kineobactrum salinum]|uniref:Uncharacterized protein n=2 Tax=Kineobactrum salinum TaxID=2708301 RepID=A0A6C0U5Q1_9GAMM|nr:hypothetical protein G3T16_01580 [Kineobactrum salinum]